MNDNAHNNLFYLVVEFDDINNFDNILSH